MRILLSFGAAFALFTAVQCRALADELFGTFRTQRSTKLRDYLVPIGDKIMLTNANGSYEYEVVVVTDLDQYSKHPTKNNTWQSFMKKGEITVNQDLTKASVVWQNGSEISLQSSISAGGRGMELSDLVVFGGHLLSVDDRTGIVYKIVDNEAFPWVLLVDGAGNATKGFKGEWMTVKDGELYVGGFGKEWTTPEGAFVNENPMWIKQVTKDGCVRNLNWAANFKKLRSAAGIEFPGYMIHESAQWSALQRKWFFLPRRASKQAYNDAADEGRGTNYLLVADEHFSHVDVLKVGSLEGSPRGFSAFQFLPGSDDQVIVALKSEEKDGVPVGSYISIFNYKTGTILLAEQPLPGKLKYEGIALLEV